MSCFSNPFVLKENKKLSQPEINNKLTDHIETIVNLDICLKFDTGYSTMCICVKSL